MDTKICLIWAALACAVPQFAQTPAEGLTQAQLNARAKAQNVPEIPFDSVPNFLKLPPNLYLGEGIGVATNSKGHVFVYTRSQATRLFEFDANGTYVREIGEGLYGFAFAHAVRVDPAGQHLGGGRGVEHGDQVQPRRPRRDGAGQQAGAGASPRRPAPRALPLQPSDRRRLGRGGEHLRLRRLRQFARGEVRQERALHHVGGQQGLRAGPAESAAHHGDGCQGQRLRRRPQQQPHPGLRQRPELQGHLRPGGRAVGGVHHARAASVSLQLQLESRTTTIR